MSIQDNEVMVNIPADDAVEYVREEMDQVRKLLKNTQIYGSVCVFGLMMYMFSIANGFASNLEPKEAAKIAKGLVVQQLEGAQPQLSSYLSTEIPSLIKSVPEYAKNQMPIYRESLEETLELQFDTLATDTSDTLDYVLTEFLNDNEDQFKTIILAGQDKETTDEVAAAMKLMFMDYLTERHGEDESIQEKLDKALAALKEVEAKTHRLAHAGDLDKSEKNMRRAIACLFTTVQENKDAVPTIDVAASQQAVSGLMNTASN